MSEKPTPGPWATDATDVSDRYRYVLGAGRLVCRVVKTDAQSEADARLIAEAGSVYHEYGLTPRELVEQREAFIAALRKMIEWEDRERDHSIDFYARMELCEEAFRLMRAALANTEMET